MNNYPIVSVITCSYNNLEHIYKTIDSVLTQNYSNIEYIISDDGSKCFEEEKIRNHIENNNERGIPYKILHHNNNIGTVRNMNNAYKAATGNYFVNLSCGDVFFDVDTVRKIVERFEESKSDVVVTSRIMYKDEFTPLCFLPHYKERSLLESYKTGLDQYKALITRRFYDMASGSSMYFSREVMEKVGYFDEKYYLWEDGPFLAKYLQFGKLEMAYDIVTTWYETGGVSHDNKKNAMNPYMEKDARLFDSTNRLERLDLFSYKQKRIIHFENLLFEYKYSFIKYLIYLIYIPEYISTRAYYKKRNNEIKNDVTMIESLLNDNIISH